MNALNKIGGALLAPVLAIAVIIGFQTRPGGQFWDGVWRPARSVVGFVGDQIARLGGNGGTPATSGGASASAPIVFTGLITLVPGLPGPAAASRSWRSLLSPRSLRVPAVARHLDPRRGGRPGRRHRLAGSG